MPHIVVEGFENLRLLGERFKPILSRKGKEVLKVQEPFLNAAGTAALLECVAVEGARQQQFFVLLTCQDRTVKVRLHPAVETDKTHGVKKILALIARQLKGLSPEFRYGATNLSDYLIEE